MPNTGPATLPAVDARIIAAEGRHRVGSDPWWGETWCFDVVDPAAGVAAFVQLTVHPRRRTCWFWAAVLPTDGPYVLCRDLDLGPPHDPLEIRGQGLWAHLICETAGEHWTVAMEAFALELEPPEEAWAGERGTRVGLAFDLEWESTDPLRPAEVEGVTTYRVEGPVNGVLQLGDRSWAIDGRGARSHAWGRLDPTWWSRQVAAPTTAGGVEGTAAPWAIDLPDGLSVRAERRLVDTGGVLHWVP